MDRKATVVDLVIAAMQKLDPRSGERRNVMAFVQSCYCARVLDYDLDAALASLSKVTDEEQHALITWVILADDCTAKYRPLGKTG